MAEVTAKRLVVPRSKVAAARSQIKRDEKRGLKSDPRIIAIANAKPASSGIKGIKTTKSPVGPAAALGDSDGR